MPDPEDSDEEENPFVGPYRVFPGRLSVCRTFGDCEAKLSHLGGVQGVVTCEPEITREVDGSDSIDYVLIGSDGIFDKMKNDTINEIIWNMTTKQRALALSQGQVPSVHKISGLVADEVLHAAARSRSLDNISVVFVAFKRFKEYIEMTNQEYISPPPIPQHITLQLNSEITDDGMLSNKPSEEFISHKVTPLRHEIMHTMKSKNGSSVSVTQSSHKDRNMLPKTTMLNQFPLTHHNTINNSMPGSHKASLIGGTSGIDVTSSGSYTNSNTKVAALHNL